MHSPVALPEHARWFQPNLGFGITTDGFASCVSVFNYYNTLSLSAAREDSAAVAEVSFFDPAGHRRFRHTERLAPFGSLHLDLRSALSQAAAEPSTYGAVLCRLIPESLPPSFAGTTISTEFIVEITSPGGAKSMVHNVGSIVYGPNREVMASEEVFCDDRTASSFLTLFNTYDGPRIPFISRGRAFIRVTNHRGATLSAWSESAPPRGTVLFSFRQHFPRLREFLDGQGGRLEIESYNLIRKPLTWITSPTDATIGAINHL